MTAYPASAFIWLEDYERARSHAERAVAVHASTSALDPSPGHVAIAWIDLGIALCHLDAPDEAAGFGRIRPRPWCAKTYDLRPTPA